MGKTTGKISFRKHEFPCNKIFLFNFFFQYLNVCSGISDFTSPEAASQMPKLQKII